MSKQYEKLQRAEASVRQYTDFVPAAGLVLGSGLGEYARQMDVRGELPYSEIEGFPVSTVEGHDGRFLFGYVRNVPLVVMKGRVHYYEGYSMEQVVMPIRLMGMLGAKKLLLTNAAGGINTSFAPGDLMMITDHISTHVPSPLLGENLSELGVRFPDMSHVYDLSLQESVRAAAGRLNIPMREGIYLQCTGPNYETPAEIRMFRKEGADAVGMSTVCEAIAAHHMGLLVAGISCITNMAAGILDQPLNHAEVQRTADQVKEKFERLVTEIISTMA